jgi:hypothetical protein
VTSREKFVVATISVVILINVAVAAWIGIETDETNPLAYLGFGLPIALMAWWLYRILVRARTRVRSEESGVRGKLRVLAASELFGGVASINDQPLLKLDLELEVPGRTSERFTKRMVVPRLAVPAVMGGETFDVAVDPERPRNFVVSW